MATEIDSEFDPELAVRLGKIAKTPIESPDAFSRLAQLVEMETAVNALAKLGGSGLLELADVAARASEQLIRLKAMAALDDNISRRHSRIELTSPEPGLP
jgi:hypothetical protein